MRSSKLALASSEDNIPSMGSKRINQYSLKKIEPLKPAQVATWTSYKDGKNLVLHGSAGTGKTFIAMYLAFKEILSRESPYEKLIVIRSAVPVRDLGHMPGTKEEKESVYEAPYHDIIYELFHQIKGNGLFEKIKEQGLYEFMSTSFIRGLTFKKCIVLVDECENMTFQELDSIITRYGEDCKIIFCGDFAQSDLQKSSEKNGLKTFISILDKLYDFSHIEFHEDDIVRNSLVRDYLINKKKVLG